MFEFIIIIGTIIVVASCETILYAYHKEVYAYITFSIVLLFLLVFVSETHLYVKTFNENKKICQELGYCKDGKYNK